MIKKFPFHKVEKSPWPIFVSLSVLGLLYHSVMYFHSLINFFFVLIFFFLLIMKLFMWWQDVMNESNKGFHKTFILKKFYIGMLLMILSEVFFFLSFFWGFFHNCWFPSKEVGKIWPPIHFNPMMVDSFSIPLLKTIMLLSSGVTVTWSHHSLIKKEHFSFSLGLILTMFLGLMFLFLQKFEYLKSFFSFKTLVYGSCFYMLTGFHGAHVIAGTMFLFVSFFRVYKMQFKSEHHMGLELAIWYWHFVDVVWLFLFIFVYWYTSVM